MNYIENFLDEIVNTINRKSDYKIKNIKDKHYTGGKKLLDKPVAFVCSYSRQSSLATISLESQNKSGYILLRDLYESRKQELENLGYKVELAIGKINKTWTRLKVYTEVKDEAELSNIVEEFTDVFVRFKDIVKQYLIIRNNTWIFQGNPNQFPIDEYVSQSKIISWNIRQPRYKDKIKLNDDVFIWRSNGKNPGGIIAYGKVTRETYFDGEVDCVDIEVKEFRLSKESGMILRNDLSR